MKEIIEYKIKYISNCQPMVLDKYPRETGQKLLKIITSMTNIEP